MHRETEMCSLNRNGNIIYVFHIISHLLGKKILSIRFKWNAIRASRDHCDHIICGLAFNELKYNWEKLQRKKMKVSCFFDAFFYRTIILVHWKQCTVFRWHWNWKSISFPFDLTKQDSALCGGCAFYRMIRFALKMKISRKSSRKFLIL